MCQSDIIQHTILGLGSEYESFIIVVTHFSGQITFDELRAKLLVHEQRILYLRDGDEGLAQHQAFAAGTAPTANPSSSTSAHQSQRGQQPQRNSNNNNQQQGGRGSHIRGRGSRNRGRGTPKATTAGQHASTSAQSSGTSSVEGVFGSAPLPIVCQICFHPGHSAIACSSCYNQASIPAFAAHPTGEHNESLWYLDSGASAHMTSNEGILTHKIPYSGPLHVTVANGTTLPVQHLGQVSLQSLSRPLTLKNVLHVPNITQVPLVLY